ncbi:MAG TPA: B12-binding domain-containing radical SAM protein, partial [Desulfosarcina sp.]|nr:B12-binding domain-containing radical SAM protein [Desulfosarcina sp.]
MTVDTPHILLVNPWIDDFAAYDAWAQPMGLLLLAGQLHARGYRLTYCDCLDRFHPRAPRSDPLARQGRGPYLKTPLPNPPGLEDIPRRYSRYGIREAWLREDLAGLEPPDLILVTSMMTYWYPGVQATIAVLRQAFPRTPILLGGIYTTLCRDHAARTSGADQVVP